MNAQQRTRKTRDGSRPDSAPPEATAASPGPVRVAWFSPQHLQWWGMLVLTGLAMFLCYRLVEPFGSALVWAVALAVLGNPVNHWFRKRIRSRAVAAGLAIVAVAVALLLPSALVAPRLVGEIIHGAETVKAAVESGTWRNHLERVKPAARLVRWLEETANLKEMVQTAVKALATVLPTAARVSLVGAAGLFISFFLLFYFFRDMRSSRCPAHPRPHHGGIAFRGPRVGHAASFSKRIVDAVRANAVASSAVRVRERNFSTLAVMVGTWSRMRKLASVISSGSPLFSVE